MTDEKLKEVRTDLEIFDITNSLKNQVQDFIDNHDMDVFLQSKLFYEIINSLTSVIYHNFEQDTNYLDRDYKIRNLSSNLNKTLVDLH